MSCKPCYPYLQDPLNRFCCQKDVVTFLRRVYRGNAPCVYRHDIARDGCHSFIGAGEGDRKVGARLRMQLERTIAQVLLRQFIECDGLLTQRKLTERELFCN